MLYQCKQVFVDCIDQLYGGCVFRLTFGSLLRAVSCGLHLFSF